jgi:hypothetical protein
MVRREIPTIVRLAMKPEAVRLRVISLLRAKHQLVLISQSRAVRWIKIAFNIWG